MTTSLQPFYVYDPLYGQVEIDSPFVPIVNSIYFRRLQHLRQLGLCYLAFPGGNHTRFEHCIGAFHLVSFLKQIINNTDELNKDDKNKLLNLLRLSTLCHDIGHGPFSHMTENVLTGLGATFSHEELGAAIVVHLLSNELASFNAFGITPIMIGQLITKSSKGVLEKCAEGLVSSDLDLDRLDYLHRDSHYTSMNSSLINPSFDLSDVWTLKRFGRTFQFELTKRGVEYAENMLLLRRNNYRRIVYDSHHMCLTAMFEKAVYALSKDIQNPFGEYCKDIVNLKLDWTDKSSFEENFPKIWKLYGLADYQALDMLEETELIEVRQLVRRIRNGNGFSTLDRFYWSELHYVAKQLVLSIKTDCDAMNLRRKLELILVRKYKDMSPMTIACHIPRFISPKPLSLGTSHGNLLEEASGLGRFLFDDVRQQYAIEFFVDQIVSDNDRKDMVRELRKMLCGGEINFEEIIQ